MQDRGLAAYIAELIGTFFLVFVFAPWSCFSWPTAPDRDRLGLRGRRPRPRVPALRADHRLRRGQRRALQPGGHPRRGGDPADRPGRRGRLHPRPALRRRARRARGQGPPARRGPRGRLRRRRGQPAARRELRRRGGRGDRNLPAGPRRLRGGVNPRERQEWAPLAIGPTLGFDVMIFGPLTGGSVNPARWFGPALIGNEWGGDLAVPARPDGRRPGGRRSTAS